MAKKVATNAVCKVRVRNAKEFVDEVVYSRASLAKCQAAGKTCKAEQIDVDINRERLMNLVEKAHDVCPQSAWVRDILQDEALKSAKQMVKANPSSSNKAYLQHMEILAKARKTRKAYGEK
jgi:hypothetical protein